MAGLIALALGLAWTIFDDSQASRLVRLDPDSLTGQPQLMRYAVSRGRGLYDSRCAQCHGSDGSGHTGRGVPNLTDKDWLYESGQVSDIETVVLFGIRAHNGRSWQLADMPAFATPVPYPREKALQPLAPGDIRDVVQFLRLAEGKSADGAAAGRGRAIYSGRGGCYDCHGTDMRGDASIGAPDLTDTIWLYGDGSDASIFRSIAYGHAGVCPAWFNRLGAAQIREVSAFVYSLSHGDAQPKQSQP